MTAHFAATTRAASLSASSATTMTTAATGLMSQWNVASAFILIPFFFLLFLTFSPALNESDLSEA